MHIFAKNKGRFLEVSTFIGVYKSVEELIFYTHLANVLVLLDTNNLQLLRGVIGIEKLDSDV